MSLGFTLVLAGAAGDGQNVVLEARGGGCGGGGSSSADDDDDDDDYGGGSLYMRGSLTCGSNSGNLSTSYSMPAHCDNGFVKAVINDQYSTQFDTSSVIANTTVILQRTKDGEGNTVSDSVAISIGNWATDQRTFDITPNATLPGTGFYELIFKGKNETQNPIKGIGNQELEQTERLYIQLNSL